ncbi:MAG: 16S rRNA (guanine(527)-N(7))-methyltransferase RsmG [Ruminococcaceae bacterium]|nr:16S rRNA (guanine(527)-N(7))-methyltransferase RsmG [Oscillospiraceae bacterium]
MAYDFFKVYMCRIFESNGLEKYLTTRNVRNFYKLTGIMTEKNDVMNITAIHDIEKVIALHHADCLKIADYIPEGAEVIDVGCGGGFPTLPLAIVRPDIHITALDSTQKKVLYVEETARELGLDNVRAISGRAEELSKLPSMREAFDVAVSRAVARLNILDELCLPFVKIGGRAVFMKGADGENEYIEAEKGIESLGGGKCQMIKEKLIVDEEVSEKRTQIIVEKLLKTHEKYPRQFGQIKKKPL